jgi:hypothetical protein
MKSKSALLAAMAMAALANPYSSFIEPKKIAGTKKHIPIKPKVIPKGCKEFEFDGFKCIALNQKSANKKYQNYLTNRPLRA